MGGSWAMSNPHDSKATAAGPRVAPNRNVILILDPRAVLTLKGLQGSDCEALFYITNGSKGLDRGAKLLFRARMYGKRHKLIRTCLRRSPLARRPRYHHVFALRTKVRRPGAELDIGVSRRNLDQCGFVHNHVVELNAQAVHGVVSHQCTFAPV